MRAIAVLACQAGLKVVELPGWEARGLGPLTPEGVLLHHTGTKADATTALLNGRKDLRGPLCNFELRLDGTVALIASGKANHAGEGTVSSFRWYGIEATGGLGRWPETQLNAYTKLVACICRHHKWDPQAQVRGHKETARPVGRKVDPSFDLNAFRGAVAVLLKTQPPPHEGGMTLDEAVKKEFQDLKRGLSILLHGDTTHPVSLESIAERLAAIEQKLATKE